MRSIARNSSSVTARGWVKSKRSVIRRDQGTALFNVIAQHLFECGMQQMSGRVMQDDGLAAWDHRLRQRHRFTAF